jgi:hypothetical protein
MCEEEESEDIAVSKKTVFNVASEAFFTIATTDKGVLCDRKLFTKFYDG